MNSSLEKPVKIHYDIANFNIEQIADSGQCFCIEPVRPQTYCMQSRGKYGEIFQNESELILTCMPEDTKFWENYLDLSTDYSAIIASIKPEDSYLISAARYGQGIRILRQDPWEMIITFIISQQKTIPKIREAIKALSQAYGSQQLNFRGQVYWSFPTPAQLQKASLDDLKALKLGYRAKYIYQTCQDAVCGKLDLNQLVSLPYKEALNYLMQFFGIGEKVANCICLFGLHHVDAFPVDTWIKKILMKYYWKDEYNKLPKNHLFPTMVDENFSSYCGCAGIMQQYIFFYERSKEKES